MELTTGAILRRITNTNLSTAAHKLATLILDGIAWKDGYNGLPRGTAAFALVDLAERMDVSRQYLHILLNELAASGLRLVRHRGRGNLAPWLFRFAGCDEADPEQDVSTTDDTALYKEDSNKNVFFGTIRVDCEKQATPPRWLALISRAKATLPCHSADSRYIWDRFRAFNRRRGNDTVPAGYLLGFMRKWRAHGVGQFPASVERDAPSISPLQRELQRLIAQAPFANRHFHERDLKRVIGEERYQAQLKEFREKYSCSEFQARLALHGKAAASSAISR